MSESMTAAEFVAKCARDRGALARHKYAAVPTIQDGVRYPSKAEAERASQLAVMLAAGVIRWYARQPKFTLGVPENVYIADFVVCDAAGVVRAEDVKGTQTPKFMRDKRLWKSYGPCELWVLTKGKPAEVVRPKGERGATP